jgi:hypothetical protein
MKIKFQIGNKEVELSIEEAKTLKEELNKLFPTEEQVPLINYYYKHKNPDSEPFKWPYEIWCRTFT